MKRRDFCKLMAAGAAGLMAFHPRLSSPEAEAKTSDNWMKWFCEESMPHPPGFDVADGHFHFYDFIQHTDGINELIKAMDENRVEHIMFSGMPLTKKWDRYDHRAPVYYLDNNSRAYWYSATDLLLAKVVEKIPDKERHRFHPFICGFNSTDMYAVEHVERMLDAYEDGFWHGIGEAFAHRDDLTNLTFGETAQADHPALMKIYKLAGEKQLPVTIHNNVSSRGRQTELLYQVEVENAVRENQGTKFIWAHAGLSRYFDDIDQRKYTDVLGGMLAEFSNLHIDLSWLVFEDYVAPDPYDGPLDCWVDLIGSFQDRFLIGTDSIGHFSFDKLNCPDGPKDPTRMKYAFNIRKYYVLFNKLSRTATRMVARENFLNLLPPKKT